MTIEREITLEARRWDAVQARITLPDDPFILGVKTTGIFCLPTCHSRMPKRENVVFFDDVEAAQGAGLRACKRCHPLDQGADGERLDPAVDAALATIRAAGGPVPREELAAASGTSVRHLHRRFVEQVGVTPAQFGRTLRAENAREHLRNATDVTSAVYESGYGSSRAFYEGAAWQLGTTPSRYRTGDVFEDIVFGMVDTTLGEVWVAATGRGVCAVKLGLNETQTGELLTAEFPHAYTWRNDRALAEVLAVVRDLADGHPTETALPVDVRATSFQAKVWLTLREIPRGWTWTYGEVADAIGTPNAVRAVGHACATNPVALVVPCHRVVRSDGGLGGYYWGIETKQTLLASEYDDVIYGPAEDNRLRA